MIKGVSLVILNAVNILIINNQILRKRGSDLLLEVKGENKEVNGLHRVFAPS